MQNILLYSEYNILLEEQRILVNIDNYFELLNEGFVRKVINEAKKVLIDVINYFTKAKELTKEFLNKVTKFMLSIYEKMKPEKKDKATKTFNMLTNHIGKTISNNVDEETSKEAVEEALSAALEMGMLDKDDLINSFKENKDDVIKLIKETVSNKLEKAKQEILSDLEDVDEKISKDSNILKKISLFAAGSTTMLVFGLIDNLGLFMGMEGVEKWVIEQGFDSQVAAGLGNTFSDALGAILGGAVMALVFKLTGVKGEGTTAEQIVGVTVGCLLPVFGKILFMVL
jgi:hypothetical protein